MNKVKSQRIQLNESEVKSLKWILVKFKGCVLHFCHKKMSYVFPPHNKSREIRAQILLKKKKENQIIQVTNGDDMYICHGDLEK